MAEYRPIIETCRDCGNTGAIDFYYRDGIPMMNRSCDCIHGIKRSKAMTTGDEGKAMKLSYEQRKLYECKVCGNVPDDDGMLSHGRGCYVINEDGGGEEFVEMTSDEVAKMWNAVYSPNGLKQQIEQLKTEVECQKHLREESQEFHRAAIEDAYKILGIDGSDGEFRYKWVRLEISKLKQQLADLRQRVRELEMERDDLIGGRPVF